jgi:hypothetical protein
MRRLLTAATLGLGLIAAATTGTAAFAMPAVAGHHAPAVSAPIAQARFGGNDHHHAQPAPRHWHRYSHRHSVPPRHTSEWKKPHQYSWR